MKQLKLFNRIQHYYDQYCLNLKDLTYLEQSALKINYHEGSYLIARYKGQEHVFLWYKKMKENKPFQDFFRQCSVEAEVVNSHFEPVWIKKLFEKINIVCYNTKFFYDLFCVIFLEEYNQKRFVNNYRRHSYAKRLISKI